MSDSIPLILWFVIWLCYGATANESRSKLMRVLVIFASSMMGLVVVLNLCQGEPISRCTGSLIGVIGCVVGLLIPVSKRTNGEVEQ